MIETKSDCSSFNLSNKDILGLYYCGDYAAAAYQIFIRRDMATNHQDHALTWYIEYQRGKACSVL